MPTLIEQPHPHVIRLPDGRTVFVEVPAEYVRRDRTGQTGFSVAGVKFLDRIRAVASEPGNRPTPGHIVALREALGLTQKALGEQVGVDKLTVSRWERGELRPGAASLKTLQKIRSAATRRGVVIE